VSLAVIGGFATIRALLLWLMVQVNVFKLAMPGDLPFVAGAGLFIGFLVRAARHPSSFGGGLQVAGAAMVVSGVLIFAAALIAFGNSWRLGIDSQAAGKLVTTGIFAYSRNPIFVFLDLYLAGTFFLNESVAFLLFACAGIAGLHIQILREETFLRQHYGTAYLEYCAKTPRYFPGAIHRVGWKQH